MAIIVNLDIMMARRKISLGELAEKVDITPANLSILKTGKAKAIRFSTLEAICKELDCQPGDILEYQEGDEWKEEIDKVLEELGEATIGYDKVENIHFDKNDIRITTSYSVRCCPCSNDMTIPLEVLLDKEPIKKAKYVYQQKELEKFLILNKKFM